MSQTSIESIETIEEPKINSKAYFKKEYEKGQLLIDSLKIKLNDKEEDFKKEKEEYEKKIDALNSMLALVRDDIITTRKTKETTDLLYCKLEEECNDRLLAQEEEFKKEKEAYMNSKKKVKKVEEIKIYNPVSEEDDEYHYEITDDFLNDTIPIIIDSFNKQCEDDTNNLLPESTFMKIFNYDRNYLISQRKAISKKDFPIMLIAYFKTESIITLYEKEIKVQPKKEKKAVMNPINVDNIINRCECGVYKSKGVGGRCKTRGYEITLGSTKRFVCKRHQTSINKEITIYSGYNPEWGYRDGWANEEKGESFTPELGVWFVRNKKNADKEGIINSRPNQTSNVI